MTMSFTEGQHEHVVAGGGIEVLVTADPFSFRVVREEDGDTLLQAASGPEESGYAPIAVTENAGFYWNRFYWGYRGYSGLDKPWSHAARTIGCREGEDRVFFEIEDELPLVTPKK